MNAPATHDRQNVEQLQRELAINKSMAENSPVNIILANTDLEITYANPASVSTLKPLEKFLPCKVEEVVGQCVDIFHKDPAYQRRILSNDKNLPHRAVIDIGDQKADLLVSATYDEDGNYLGPLVTWEVVTEKLKLEREAAEKNSLVENAPINILLADTDLNIRYVNPASYKQLKALEQHMPCRVDDLVGQSIDIFHKNPQYQRDILSNHRRLPHQAVIDFAGEKLDLLVSPTFDSEGNYTGPMVSWSVVTEKVALEARNYDFTNQINAISAAWAVIEFEPDGTIVTANDNFLNTLGYSLSEIEGKHHQMFVDPEYGRSREYQEFWARLGRGEAQEGEFMRMTKTGEEVWIQARYGALLDENGKVYKVVKYATVITEAVKGRRDAAEKASIVENAPINIMLANTEGTITYLNPASDRTLRTIEHLLPIPVDQIVGSSYDVFHKNPAHQRKLLGDPRNLPHEAEIKVGDEILSLAASAIYDNDGNYAGPMVAWSVITEQKRAAERERENQERDRRNQEELQRKVEELLTVVNAAAEGDLTQDMSFSGEDAMGKLADGFRQMMGDLRGIIGQVVEGSGQFAEGSNVIAENAQSLAQGAQTQSASVEEMSASIEELTRSIEAVKDNAGDANKVAGDTSSMAEEGGQAVQKSVEAMDLIKSSSEQISEIIQVISEIASQTNLLALNAAIEAARAGEHGLGFAVVADEVRKLAERSSEAAKEISSLIKESTQRVQDGAKLSEQTGAALEKIIQGVEATANKIGEIATATVEQAQNANEVANAIQQVSQVTEQSAAASEEMASSSEELGAQATSMRELVSRFKVEN